MFKKSPMYNSIECIQPVFLFTLKTYINMVGLASVLLFLKYFFPMFIYTETIISVMLIVIAVSLAHALFIAYCYKAPHSALAAYYLAHPARIMIFKSAIQAFLIVKSTSFITPYAYDTLRYGGILFIGTCWAGLLYLSIWCYRQKTAEDVAIFTKQQNILYNRHKQIQYMILTVLAMGFISISCIFLLMRFF